jgi:hypothetical protein
MDSIFFSPNRNLARIARVSEMEKLSEALALLDVSFPRKTIVLVGGAGNVKWRHRIAIRRATNLIARVAFETRAVVVDGATNFGVIAAMGKQRKRHGNSFPLIGVTAEAVLGDDPPSMLEPNHSQFIFVPGAQWGDESEWIAKTASIIAQEQTSVTVLINGGEISKIDVQNSLRENRMVIAMRGTGRLADEIETAEGKIIALNIFKNEKEGRVVLRSLLSV